MLRRDFIIFLGGAAAAWPPAAFPQQAIPVIGFLHPGSPETNRWEAAELRQGLKDAGYVEGQNVAIDYRWANGQFGRLRSLADDLVRRQVAVIVAPGPVDSALAAKAATSTIPIVIAGGEDPVRHGLVDSLNRPGGNVTGVTYLHNELAGKRLDLLGKLAPQVMTVGYLVGGQQNSTSQELTSEMIAVAHELGRRVVVLKCRSAEDFEAAFATLVERQAGALVVSAFLLALNNRWKILALAAHHKIPAIYPQSRYAYDGGLMSYSAVGTIRQVGIDFIARILKGAKPADLPVRRPNRFHFVVNLKTAKALGVTVPAVLLASADEVIE